MTSQWAYDRSDIAPEIKYGIKSEFSNGISATRGFFFRPGFATRSDDGPARSAWSPESRCSTASQTSPSHTAAARCSRRTPARARWVRWRSSAIRKVSDEPFSFLIYTHGHGDHAFGTEAFIDDNLSRGYPRPKIWAHEDVAARFARYRATRGWQAHINSLQFGVQIAPDAMFADRILHQSRPDLSRPCSRSSSRASRSNCATRWVRRTTRPGSGCRGGGSRWSAI